MEGNQPEGLCQQRIVSISQKHIPEVDIIKTLDDTIFGEILLGKFVFEGEFEVNYTYIKRLDPGCELEQADFWNFVASSKKHPEKGFIPKILAFSTQSESLKGYLDSNSDHHQFRKEMLAVEGENFIKNISNTKIRELYFEPFPENLRIILHKRTKDRLTYSEKELMLFITSMLQTLKNMEEHGIRHGNINLDCIVPTPQAYYLYHPALIPSSVNAFSRVHALVKHYVAPEVVDLILECNTESEFISVVDEIDWRKADAFSVGLITLEMASLVEEEDFYNEDMILRKDILELKMNLVRNNFSAKLARILEALISPYQIRPNLEGLLKLIIPASDNLQHYQRLLHKQTEDSQKDEKSSPAPKKKENSAIPSDFASDKVISSHEETPERDVSDIDSKDARNLEERSRKLHADTPHSVGISNTNYLPFSHNTQSPVTFPHKREHQRKEQLHDPITAEQAKPFNSMIIPSTNKTEIDESPKMQGPLKHETAFDSQSKSKANMVLPFEISTIPTGQDYRRAEGNNFNNAPSRSYQIWSPLPSQTPSNQVKLPPMQKTVITPAQMTTIPQIISQPIVSYHSSTAREGFNPVFQHQNHPFQEFKKDLTYDPKDAHPTGKCTVREDRSKSPKLVSVKKYIIKDGQKILLSEENYPGYDDGFRGFIDYREKTPEKIANSASKDRNKLPGPTPGLQTTQYTPQVVSTNKSLEPIFGTDSIYKPASMSSSKIHSLIALQKNSNHDFSKMAEEIKGKLDELILKERAREEKEKQLADEMNRSKSKKEAKKANPIDQTPNTKADQSSKSYLNLDLSNVECCKDCKRLKKDKKTHLYKCLNHPQSPIYVEEKKDAKSQRSITSEKRPVSIERKLLFQQGDFDSNLCPRFYKAVLPSPKITKEESKKLIPLVHTHNGNELVSAHQIKKFRESMADAKQSQLKKKAHIDLTAGEAKTQKSKSKKKTQKENKDPWARRMQINEGKADYS